MKEIITATTGTMQEHGHIGRISGTIKDHLRNDAAGYFAGLKSNVEGIIQSLNDATAGEIFAVNTPGSYCEIAQEHASSAAESVSGLLGATNPNAQNLMDITAEGVRMTKEWTEGVPGNPGFAIPESVFNGLEAAMDGLQDTINALKAAGDTVEEQGKMLAGRSVTAGNDYLTDLTQK